MAAACGEFERSLGNSPILINDGGVSPWFIPKSPWAEARLKELSSHAREFRQEYRYPIEPKRASSFRDSVALLGCAIVASAVLFVFLAGIIAIGSRLYSSESDAV